MNLDLTSTIIPKSDQLNSDDLIGGTRTIRISAVATGGSPEQPVSLVYESEPGRPYKPCKSMRRVLVSMWGADGTAYVGRRLTLYRDPAVKWAGEPVGGIRISHASDITETVCIALTETRGRRKPFRVEPMAVERAAERVEVDLGPLPESWTNWPADMRGENRAAAGMSALKAWFATLAASDKKALKSKLDADWKPAAEAADNQRADKLEGGAR